MNQKKLLLAVAVFVLAVVYQPCRAQLPESAVWVSGSYDLKTVRTGQTLYVGHTGGYFGRYSGFSARLDAASGQAVHDWPIVDGPVYSIISDGANGWYLGGQFQHVAGLPRSNLVHILADGEVDPDFVPPAINGAVRALAQGGGVIFIGGTFTQVGTDARFRLAALDTLDAGLLDWIVSPNSYVYSLLLIEDRLYIGGIFSAVANRTGTVFTRNRLAAIRTTDETVLSWDPTLVGSQVNTIKSYGANIYIGGYFSQVAGQPRNYLAAFEFVTGNLTAWNPGTNGEVFDMALADGMAYVCGSFSSAGTINPLPRNNLAAISLLTSTVSTAWNPGAMLPEDARSIAVYGNTVYVGGGSRTLLFNGQNYLLAIDRQDDTRQRWLTYSNGPVFSVAATTERILAGGEFTTPKELIKDHVAIDLATDTIQDWPLTDVGTIYDMILDGDTFYLAYSKPGSSAIGAFNRADGSQRWSIPVSPWATSLALDGNTLYAGGLFTLVNGEARSRLAAIDINTQQLLNWQPLLEAAGSFWVNDVWVDSKQIYITGTFTTVNGEGRAGFAVLDSSGQLSNFNPVTNSAITHVSFDTHSIYLSGYFSLVEGISQTGLAVFDKQTLSLKDWPIKSFTGIGVTHDSASVYASGYTGLDSLSYDIGTLAPESGSNTTWEAERAVTLLPSLDYSLTTRAYDIRGDRLLVQEDTYLDRGGFWGDYHPLRNYRGALLTYALAPPTTTADPAGGEFSGSQLVSLNCTAVGGTHCDGTYYTTDGSTPDTASTLYSGPIEITADTSLKFFSKNELGHGEAIRTVQFSKTVSSGGDGDGDGGGGGCSLKKGAGFDPTLGMFVLLSLFYLYRHSLSAKTKHSL